MKAKSSVLTIRLPKELKHRIERVADEQGVSINQLALYAFTKEIKEMETSSYFRNRLKLKDKKVILNDYDTVVKKIGTSKLPKWDVI
ncbi:MAG TPA: toxin-antitoxin system HicB family antitoxin [Spirochaetota bacterium]|jgi:predicted DNA-binding protein|nr:toxin-antitoxin system HicB family antitoxin [Spirochaetota bacterium]OPZ36391.1 MAG: hypothetical protein BWY96_02266 [Spirochaetes bacterium ADurb.BinA120]HNU90829.1 toxin-antitoxin system HicB family antitoxin [Spirochaetota bacterium]HPV97183.1 toxin-antitoxin system HicB family antitoxin [Spirochaetota bacterium]